MCLFGFGSGAKSVVRPWKVKGGRGFVCKRFEMFKFFIVPLVFLYGKDEFIEVVFNFL